MRLIDITNKKFGKLFVKSLHHRKIKKNGSTLIFWECICECGNRCVVEGYHLRHGDTTSCGCYQKKRAKEANTKHGMSNSAIERVFGGMKSRCYNKKHCKYHSYGERGIRVCDEWLKSPKKFYEWAIKNGYKKGLTIERINVNGNYSPENCKWIPPIEQSWNRRNTIYVDYNGERIARCKLKCLKTKLEE